VEERYKSRFQESEREFLEVWRGIREHHQVKKETKATEYD
jgi:hypothetical protein